MNAAFEDYRRIARVTTVQRDENSARVMKLVAALLALALLVGTGVAIARHQLELDTLARAVLGLGAFWLALVWATLFVPGAVLLNSAANARLLPRQRRRLMQMTAAGWLVSTAGFCIVMDSWAVLPLAGLYLIGFPLMLTGHRQSAPLIFLACCWPMLARTVLPHWLVETVSRPASVLALGVLLLVLGAACLRLLYPAGGDAHLDKRGEQLKRMQRFSGRAAADAGEAGGAAGWGIRRVYGLALRRDCRRADPGTMLMHAIGPAAHWSAWLGGMTVTLAGGAALRLMLAWRGAGPLNEALNVAATVGMATIAAIVVFSTALFSQQLRRTRGEQALLRLTPLAGDASLLNRRLAGQLLKSGLRNWAMLTATVMIATLLVGGDRDALLRQFGLCCLAGQAAMMGLLGDYAGEGGWNLMLGLRAGVLAACEASVAVGLGWLTGTSVWPWVIGIALVGAVVQLRLSWRGMLAAPVAFPAGRMA
jgi:hypothetical protein